MEFVVPKIKKRVSSGGTGETNGKEERWKVKDYGNCPRPIYPYLRLFIQRKLASQEILRKPRQSTYPHCCQLQGSKGKNTRSVLANSRPTSL